MHWCLEPLPPSRAPSLARLLQHSPKLYRLSSCSGLSTQPLPCLCSNFVFSCWSELLDSCLHSESSSCLMHIVYILAPSMPWSAVWTVVWSLKVACMLCWMSYSASLKGHSAAVWVIVSNHPSLPDLQLFRVWSAVRQRAFPLAGGTAQTLCSSSFSGESGAGKTESTKLILKFLSAMSQHSLELSCREKTSCVEQAILESRY